MNSGDEAAEAPEWLWDAAQRAVLELDAAASGVVVGAPGTGKTTVLVERVRRLIGLGVDADALLVLTPSRQTATALRDRLALTIGSATAGPLARSVASFAFQLVRAAEVERGGEPPQLLTGGDEDQIIEDLLVGDAADEHEDHAARWPEWLGRDIRSTPGFRTEVRTFLAECTTLGIEAAQLAALARTHGVPEWEALASFMAEYLQVRADMRGAHRDAAGLVREAVGLARTATTGPITALDAVLVDDAQELTLGAVEMLEALRARGVAVLAFGDPDIGSGSFRGARPENFARLAATISGTLLALDGQHRSTPAQTEIVRAVTQRIGAVGVVAHRAAPTGAEPDASVRSMTLRSASEEYDVIARLLRERHVHDGVPWAQCAVIAHDTRQVAALEAELTAREVPARAVGPGRPLGTIRPVRDLLEIVALATRDPAEWAPDEVSGALLGVAGGFDPVGLRRLRTSLRHAELARPDAPGPDAPEVDEPGESTPTMGSGAPTAAPSRSGAIVLTEAMAEPLALELLDTREGRRAARLARTLAALREQAASGATAHELLWRAWEDSGLERTWSQARNGYGPLAEQADRDLDAVVALFQAAKRFSEREPNGDAQAFVRSMLEADVSEDRLGAPTRADSVQVLTPAAAAGVEFDTVVVAGVQDGIWPNTRLRGSLLQTWRLADASVVAADDVARGDGTAPGLLDRRRAAMYDELRLFARALSRARARLIVTAVDDDDAGPSVFFELLPPAQTAGRDMEHPLTLRGLVAKHRRSLTDPLAPARERERAPGQLALLASAGVPAAHPSHWYGVLAPSSTGALRDLARADVRVSPSRLHTLEECELNWVLGELGADSGGAVAGLGTIIHAALETVPAPDESSLWAAVEARWGELEFESAWRDRAEKTRARDLIRRLNLYLTRFEASGGALIGAEPHFEVPIALTAGRDADIETDAATLPDSEGEPDRHRVLISGYIDRVELTPEGTVVIVDLKTGKREPQTDVAVADNPQLAAYQLAFEAGAIAEAAGHAPGGAKLLVLRPTATRKDYAEPWQAPFDEERRTAFLDRVRAAVDVMTGVRFHAPFEEHCRDDHTYGLCRVHTVKAVSAS